MSEFDPPPPEQLYHLLFDSIPSSVLLIDAAQRILSANRNFLHKSRLSARQVLRARVEDVFPAIIAQQMNLRGKIAEVFRTGEPIKGERVTYRAPGVPTRFFCYSIIPCMEGLKVSTVLLLMEDVTDRIRLGEEARRAERHLASVVESASDFVVSTDLHGRILTWNTAAARATGYDELDVHNRRLADLCPEEERVKITRFLTQVLAVGSDEPFETELVSLSGQTIPVSWVCSPMRDDDGLVIGLVAVGRDLTERRKFEQHLIQAEKLAALGVMAGGIAHEIRNPLAVVSSAAQLLKAGVLSPELAQECADRIHRGVQRVAGVIENLLRFARPSDKGTKKPLDLKEVIAEAVELTDNQLKIARAELSTELASEPLTLLGNAGLLQQLLMNLFLNAANAMHETGGVIRVVGERRDESIRVQVHDNGRGIAAEDLPKVFDPFFTRMPVGRGTGLGLSICYAIVQQHDGRIEISSREGEGTTVTITFPCCTPEQIVEADHAL